jgi:hypothetical protein
MQTRPVPRRIRLLEGRLALVEWSEVSAAGFRRGSQPHARSLRMCNPAANSNIGRNMVQINHQNRLIALDTLLNARMAHTRWVSEVTHEHTPCVEEDHTRCKFGHWLLLAEGILGGVKEFRDLVEPHKQLHLAYLALKSEQDRASLCDTIKEMSRILIDRIDLLESHLKQQKLT